MIARAFVPITGVPASDDDIARFAARKGVPTLTEVVPTQQLAETDTVRISLELPRTLADALHTRAFQQRCSKRHVIMLALKQAGFPINDADLVPDGRRLR